MRKKILGVFVMSMLVAGLPMMVFAASCGGVETSVINCEDGNGINGILHLIINIMTGIIGILAVAGIVFSGLQYSTSAGDVAKMAKAKNRIVQIVIGLIVFAVMWVILDFLIPGGILAG